MADDDTATDGANTEGTQGDPASQAGTTATGATAATTTTPGDTATGQSADVGDAGKAAIAAERTARKNAERQAREALNAHARAVGVENPDQLKPDEVKQAIKAKEDEQLSETDRLKKQAEDGTALASKAQAKLRKANLLTVLNDPEHKIVSPQAAAKLIDGVEYDDADEPTNVTERIEALLTEHPFLKQDGKQTRQDNAAAANPATTRKQDGDDMNALLRKARR